MVLAGLVSQAGCADSQPALRWSSSFPLDLGSMLEGVWGSSATDVFAVGGSPFGRRGYLGNIVHYAE